jgi:dipeptidyl aminopeptidase/acylaminoacyl peptidase
VIAVSIRLAGLCLAVVCLWPENSRAAATAPPPRLPIEAFVRHSEMEQLAFSPDGRHFAALAERNGQMVLLVVEDATGKARVVKADAAGADILDFDWETDDLISMQTGKRGIRGWDLSGKEFTYGYASVSGRSRPGLGIAGSIVARVPDSQDQVIVVDGNQADFSIRLDIVDSTNGKKLRRLTPAAPGPRIWRWVLGRDLEARAAIGWDNKARRTNVWVRDGKDAPWRLLSAFDPYAEQGVVPVAVDEQDRLLVLSNVDREFRALYVLDAATGRPGELLVAHPKADIHRDQLRYGRGGIFVIGVDLEGDVPQTHWFDERRERVQASIDAALPTSVNHLQFLPDGRVLVSAYSDRDPGTYYYFDPAKRSLEEWSRQKPWIKSAQMAPMRVLRYKARDGVEIPAYLTLPAGREPKALPLVVWVHGGPIARDAWGYDTEVQFLANRGYAVLQPNFRGSAGYSEAFERLGYKQWGRAMQDDVTDGVRELVAQGLVDPSRVCIGGGSYGGYAAMMGVIREPEMFRCAVNMFGPTDLVWNVDLPSADYNWWPNRDTDRLLKMRIGDPDDPAERRVLEANSPRLLATRIKSPVLMIYGTEDHRVPLEHGTAMRDAMREAGAPFEWKSYTGEGHGLSETANRIDYLGRIERFLDEHIGRPDGK